MAYLFFDIKYAVRVHDKILEVSGGNYGVLDFRPA